MKRGDYNEKHWAAASAALRSWATTTSANNFRKIIAHAIQQAHSEGYMEGYDAGKKSAAVDRALDAGKHEKPSLPSALDNPNPTPADPS